VSLGVSSGPKGEAKLDFLCAGKGGKQVGVNNSAATDPTEVEAAAELVDNESAWRDDARTMDGGWVALDNKFEVIVAGKGTIGLTAFAEAALESARRFIIKLLPLRPCPRRTLDWST